MKTRTGFMTQPNEIVPVVIPFNEEKKPYVYKANKVNMANGFIKKISEIEE